MKANQFIGCIAMVVFLAGCAGEEMFIAATMDRQTLKRDIRECDDIADKEVAEMRAEDEKAGRRSPLTSGEIVALRVLFTVLAGNPGRSGVKGIDEVRFGACMRRRGYENRELSSDEQEKLDAARERGAELKYLEELYRKHYGKGDGMSGS